MLVKTFFQFSIIVLLLLSFFHLSFAGDNKSLKDMKRDIYEMEKQDRDFREEKTSFYWDRADVMQYMSGNIDTESLSKIQPIIDKYKQARDSFYYYLNNTQIKDIDTIKLYTLRDIYIKERERILYTIRDYINPEKVEKYLDYIKKDLDIEAKDKEMETKMIEIKKQLDEKESRLKAKMEENQKQLEDRLNYVIDNTVEEKIFAIENDSRFLSLSSTGKIKIYKSMLSNVIFQKKALEELLPDEKIKNRINIYDSIREKILLRIKELEKNK